MFAGASLSESFVDYGSLGFDGILGAANDILFILLLVFLGGISIYFIEPKSGPQA